MSNRRKQRRPAIPSLAPNPSPQNRVSTLPSQKPIDQKVVSPKEGHKTEHFSVLLPSDMLSRLRALAEREERPVSSLIRLALKDYLANHS